MAKVSDMIPSKYLKKDDVGRGMLATITRIDQTDVSMADQPEELKWVMSIKESKKGLVLNSTNIHSCATICQSDESADWVGKQIVLYDDPSITFAGKTTGGIRIRAPKLAAQASPPADDPANPVTNPDLDDDIPF